MISVACGGQHSLFLTETGEVFACGSNKYGQLGLGDRVDRMTPQPIAALPAIRRRLLLDFTEQIPGIVACGDNHSLFGNTPLGRLF